MSLQFESQQNRQKFGSDLAVQGHFTKALVAPSGSLFNSQFGSGATQVLADTGGSNVTIGVDAAVPIGLIFNGVIMMTPASTGRSITLPSSDKIIAALGPLAKEGQAWDLKVINLSAANTFVMPDNGDATYPTKINEGTTDITVGTSSAKTLTFVVRNTTPGSQKVDVYWV